MSEGFDRVALTHEWLTIPGGSEKVVLELLELYPRAEIFTSVYNPEGGWPQRLRDQTIHTSFLDRIPGAERNYPKLLPLMDTAFRRFDLEGFDLILSSNHACAKNVRTPPDALHVCYCHTPMRYAWDPSFLEGERLGRASRAAFAAMIPILRRTDLRGARQPDHFVANSTFVAQRIRRHYGREATVIHPPVEVNRFAGARRVPEEPYLFFGRVVPYKRADLAVAACERLGRKLWVAGEGRDLERVKAAAGPNTEFLGRVSDADLAELFVRSRALIFPGVEDFGIVPVEAQAAGLPVIAHGVGGARDSVVDGRTGVLYDDPSVDGLCAAIERFEGLELEDADLRAQAAGFAPDRFRDAMSDLIARLPRPRKGSGPRLA